MDTNARYDACLALAVVVAIFCPALPGIGNPANVVALGLVVCLIAFGRRDRLWTLFIGAVAILLLVDVATLVGLVRVQGASSLNPNEFGPFFRILICMVAASCVCDTATTQRRLLWIGAGAGAFGIAQFVFPEVANFTAEHYLAAERSSVFQEEFAADAIVRIIGPFENPSSVGLVCVVLIVLTLHLRARGQLGLPLLIGSLGINVVAGLLSLSKIFIAGLPLILLYMLILGHRAAVVLTLAAAAMVASVILTVESPLVDVILYAVNAALDPDVALAGRYLGVQQDTVLQSWFLGHGMVAPRNVIINDSAYLVVAYLVGAAGLAAIAAVGSWLVLKRATKLPAAFYLTLAAIGVAGLGSNSILGFRLDVYLSALCAVLYIDRLPRRARPVPC